MKIFLDTSSLLKLYHRESGTETLELIFSTNVITTIFLSEISKVEFSSAIWKKVRTNEISPAAANATIELFESDFPKYTFVTTGNAILEQARKLVSKYGSEGLRTLDSIQLSTSLALSQVASLFITSDTLLQTFFDTESLPAKLPGK